MKLELTRKFENELLERVEYEFKVSHDAQGTPSRKDLRDAIATFLGVDKDLIVIRRIKTPFGVNESIVEAFIYQSKETLLKVEPRHILKRNGII